MLVYLALAATVVVTPAAGGPILFYAILIPVALLFIHGLLLGRIRGNGVRVSARQFPELRDLAARHAATLGMDKAPDIFIMQSGGVLNAFATRFLGRDFVVLYSDVLALAEREGAPAVSFILAHELAHVRRGHLRNRWLITPGRMIPYLGAAYSRACEYTCDRFGAHCEPQGAIRGLLTLAAGPDLYQRVNVAEYAAQVETEGGFWMRRAEVMATHPHLTKRVAALIEAGVPVPGVAAPPTLTVGSVYPRTSAMPAY
jgi:Zn-dependent protease with chaperone function